MMPILYFPLALAVIGFVFTTQPFLLWYNTLSPALGLLLYYGILGVVVLLLQFLGLVVGGIRFNNWVQTLGTLLLTFAFFVVVDWESCYIQQIVGMDCDDSSPILFASEDGATYYLWSQLGFGIQGARLLTYVVTPFVLALVALLMIRQQRPSLSMLL